MYWPISTSPSKISNTQCKCNGFPPHLLTLRRRGLCHCLRWRSGFGCGVWPFQLGHQAQWMFSVETEPASSSALWWLLSPTTPYTCLWLTVVVFPVSEFRQELETDFSPANVREQTNSLCLTQYNMVATPAQGPGDSKPAHQKLTGACLDSALSVGGHQARLLTRTLGLTQSKLWFPSQFPSLSIQTSWVWEIPLFLVFSP